ncbi:hypothetical protein [Actinomadura alba]|uniref:Uncharacterized protein n=1 Tax=Actinomadura alba TaxID=406431 RepID=A0ABR7LXX2_9ACTN|nr:hypothetical protein [Actinomadura alba]MBC6469347.1 hypothetical protein [Actinomadura alba]
MNSHEPPRMYSWSIVGADGTGACGVSNDYELALDEVVMALCNARAGSRGLVHRVSPSYHRTALVYEGLVARCRIGTADAPVWDDIPPPSAWTHLRPLYTDPDHALGDAIPPEALAAGFEDLRIHRERLERTTASTSTDRR